MEDYKKKYENALDNFKKIKDANKDNNELVNFIDYEYPELKESEDERIRKELLNAFQEAEDSLYMVLTPQKRKSFIAWLEKQGKIKRSDYPYVPGWRENRPDNKPKIKHSILMLTTHGVAEGEWLGEEWCQYRWSCKVKDEDVLYWLHLSDLETLEKENANQDFSWLEKQGEQKPLNKVEQEDVELTNFESALFSAFSDAWQEYLSGKEVNVAKWAREHSAELLEVAIEQKPAWSEKDEDIFNDIIMCLDGNFKSDKSMINWLKSLKERYSWKPSDEQMKQLGWIADQNKDNMIGEELMSLYQDLKKLKG